MKAIVLVGGFGTRLRPLTLHRPKQMLPVGPVTMLERVIHRLAESGVDTAVLSLGYQPDAFIERFPDGTCAGVELHYAVEPEPLDTAGAIAFAARDAGIDETFLALNGDVLSRIDLQSLVRSHRSFGGSATIALTRVDDPSRFGVVPIDPDGRVIEFVEKPPADAAPSNWINAGTYVLEPRVLESIPQGVPTSIERVTFPALAAAGELFAVQSDAYWIDAGTPEAYLQAQLDLIDGLNGDAESLVDESVSVDPSSKVDRCALGEGVVVGPGCELRESVIMAGARIGTGVSVERCVIGGNTTIGDESVLSGLSVVGYGHEVAEGTRLDAGVLPPQELWKI